ncbi:MAG TPA: porin [Methylocella sp.]|nr:porin [Methylocella sp.]
MGAVAASLWNAAYEAVTEMQISLGETGVSKALLSILASGAFWLAGPAPVVGAADAPLPESAPINFIRVCNIYGEGNFYIPGSSACLRVGGLLLGAFGGFAPGTSLIAQTFNGNGAPHPGLRFLPAANPLGLARVPASVSDEPAFSRTENFYDSGGYPIGRSLGYFNSGFLSTNAETGPHETTSVNRAFLQFAGLTAGLAQSMFEFYADAIDFTSPRGSNATAALIAYAASPPNGTSATRSAQDPPGRRAAVGSTLASDGVTATAPQGEPRGGQVPEIAGNIRLDQSWGSVQLSGAAHQVRSSLFGGTALGTVPSTLAYPALTSSTYGFAVQRGAELNADYLSPGDKLWLQAAYEKGTVSYIAGNNDGDDNGENNSTGPGFFPSDFGVVGSSEFNADCVGTRPCDPPQAGFDITGAHKHFWIPSLASGIYGSYMPVDYPANALAGLGGGFGISNINEGRGGTNLSWTPFKNFDIGAEFMYQHLDPARPTGLAPDFTFSAAGIPALQVNTNQYEGRLRVQRAF